MNDTNIWIIIKIFPKVDKPAEAVMKVLQIKYKFLNKLMEFADDKDYYFLHYTDAPEGSHFKFALNEFKELGAVLDWKKETLRDELVKYIEIIIDEDENVPENPANKARKVFESLKIDKINLLIDIKNKLNSNQDYQTLTDESKHLLRNMAGLTYQDEILMERIL